MNENPSPDDNLVDELKNLGRNLGDLIRTAWDNPERKRIQMDIESSLSELGKSIKREADSFAESPTAQRFKNDMEEINQRIRDAETREKARKEMLGILQTANTELQNLISRMSSPESEETPSNQAPEKDQEVE